MTLREYRRFLLLTLKYAGYYDWIGDMLVYKAHSEDFKKPIDFGDRIEVRVCSIWDVLNSLTIANPQRFATSEEKYDVCFYSFNDLLRMSGSTEEEIEEVFVAKEMEVGMVTVHEGRFLRCVEATECAGCVFYDGDCAKWTKETKFRCRSHERHDGLRVKFIRTRV